jgi:chromosome segregation ATPase
MRTGSDNLKKKAVACVRLESSTREIIAQQRIESYHEKRWAEKCAHFEGLDPSTYASNKEAEQVRSREAELETRFKKIYDDTVTQMTEQSEYDQNSAAEKKRQYDVEKQNLEVQTKELRTKRVQLVNDNSALDGELDATNKEIQKLEELARDLEHQIPILEQSKGEALEKLKAAEVEMKNLASKAEQRDKYLANLRAVLKEKQDQASKGKFEEDNTLNELKERLNDKRRRIEEANIGLFPEISKYRGLVDVVEVKLTPQTKKLKRTTM